MLLRRPGKYWRETVTVPWGLSGSARRLAGTAALLILASLLASAFTIRELHNDAGADARHDAQSLGAIISEQTARSLQAVDLVLLDLRETIAATGTTPGRFRPQFATREIHDTMVRKLANLPQADALILIDAQGRSINYTRSWPAPEFDGADRSYFRHFSTTNDPGAFITEPLFNRNTGDPALYIARRLNGPNGEFLGIVLGTMRLQYFEGIYRSIGPIKGAGVTLLRRDGVVIVRYPLPETPLAPRMPDISPWHRMVAAGGGTYRTPGFLGKGTQFVSVHPLAAYPIVVDITIAEDVAFAPWRRQTLFIVLGTLSAIVCIALLARALAGQFRHLEAARSTLAHKKRVLETTLDAMDQGLIMVDADGRVAICNRRAADMLELPAGFIDNPPEFATLRACARRAPHFLETEATAALARGDTAHDAFTHERRRSDGMLLDVQSVAIPTGGFVRTYTDVTARRAAEERIRHIARHDELTGLANRTVLHETLSRELQRGRSCAVLHFDLDHFKGINDTIGHPAGDALLQAVAARLRAALRDTDLAARPGADEFVVVQSGDNQPIDAIGLAERLIAELARPFDIGGHQVTTGASAGIAIGPGDGDDADTLLKNADLALSRAKADGRGTWRCFEPIMDAQVRERRLMQADLHRALRNTEFELFFQPMLTTGTAALTGFEALLRWRHPRHGLIPPDRFIPLCEETGLIVPLGEWVLHEACRQAATWPGDYTVAVNLSSVQFTRGDIVDIAAAALAAARLPPARLDLEITESVLLLDTAAIFSTLHRLRALGLRISMDDFGTGYSSLSYLRRFPFDKIKIDKSFIRDLCAAANSRAILRAILHMGRALGMSIIAEGVETEEQLEALAAEDCLEVQGYLFSRPRPASEVPDMIARFARRIGIAA